MAQVRQERDHHCERAGMLERLIDAHCRACEVGLQREIALPTSGFRITSRDNVDGLQQQSSGPAAAGTCNSPMSLPPEAAALPASLQTPLAAWARKMSAAQHWLRPCDSVFEVCICTKSEAV